MKHNNNLAIIKISKREHSQDPKKAPLAPQDDKIDAVDQILERLVPKVDLRRPLRDEFFAQINRVNDANKRLLAEYKGMTAQEAEAQLMPAMPPAETWSDELGAQLQTEMDAEKLAKPCEWFGTLSKVSIRYLKVLPVAIISPEHKLYTNAWGSVSFCMALCALLPQPIFQGSIHLLVMSIQYAIVLRTDSRRRWPVKNRTGCRVLDEFVRVSELQDGSRPIAQLHAEVRTRLQASDNAYSLPFMSDLFLLLEKQIKQESQIKTKSRAKPKKNVKSKKRVAPEDDDEGGDEHGAAAQDENAAQAEPEAGDDMIDPEPPTIYTSAPDLYRVTTNDLTNIQKALDAMEVLGYKIWQSPYLVARVFEVSKSTNDWPGREVLPDLVKRFDAAHRQTIKLSKQPTAAEVHRELVELRAQVEKLPDLIARVEILELQQPG